MTTADLATRIEPIATAPLERIGYGREDEHAATAVIVDQDDSLIGINSPDVEVLPLAEALDRHEWVQELVFGLIRPDENPDVAQVAESTDPPVGHFVHVRAGARVELPIQLFTLLGHPQGRQHAHCVLVVGEDAEVQIVSGSTVPANVHAGRHISISETYLRAGATCRSVSIEQWGDDMEVHDYSRTHIGKGATSISTSIMMSNVRHHHSESVMTIDEDGASNEQAVLVAPLGTERVVQSETVLAGDGAHAESLARMVTAGGRITNRSTLVGDGENTRGYLGCDGLKLTDEGQILSAPGLEANSSTAQLSHEASIGVIGADKIAYLMASGLSEERARDLLIQGFLNLDENLIPEAIRDEVSAMVATAKAGAL